MTETAKTKIPVVPVLANARHEKFAQGLAKGMSATEAYRKAGYKPSDQHASRLARNGKVRARVAELQGSTAKEIMDVRDLARQCTDRAVRVLDRVMEDPKAPHSAQVAAANGLLDRGWGKAVQHIEAEISVYDALSYEDKLVLLEALDGLDGALALEDQTTH